MGLRRMLREGFEGPDAFEKRVAALDLTTLSDAELSTLYSQASPTNDTTSPANDSIIRELERRSGEPIVREAPDEPFKVSLGSEGKPLTTVQWGLIAAMLVVAAISWWNR